MIAGASRRTAVAIVNPNAGNLAPAQRENVLELLRSHFDLEVRWTPALGAGIEVAAEVALEHEIVIAFGGDGLVNEVVNGVAGSQAVLGLIPGGTMNVFARSLGIPRDHAAAVARLAGRSREDARLVNLGKVDDRLFTFSAGCGFDAEAAALVERHLDPKRRIGEPFFYLSAAWVLASSYRNRRPTMQLHGDFGTIDVSMAVACNTGPYAYLAGRAVRLTPDVRLDAGLDIFALKQMRIEALPLYAWNAAIGGDMSRHPDAVVYRDQQELTLTSEKPVPRHVDGEPLPEAQQCTFTLERDAIEVLA